MPIFMKYEGIDGSVTGKYKGWIELESCQIQNRARPSNSEIVITKSQDSASVRLFNEAISGTGKKVKVDFVNAEKVPYLSLEMENTLITSYSVSGRGDTPMESYTLNCTKLSYTNTPTSASKSPKDSKDKALWNYAVE
jgi:type VI secretion system secreted protein Hcp